MELKDMPLKALINYICVWSYEHDRRLHENMDDIFSVFHSRQGIEGDSATAMEQMRREQPNILAVFEAAISKADYHDTYKFQWALNGSGNRDHSYAYKSYSDHPYKDVREIVHVRLYELEQLGLNDWRLSADHEKFKHYRQNVTRLMLNSSERYRPMTLLYADYDTVNCSFNMGAGEYNEFYFKALQYLLNNNIVPDPHGGRKSIDYHPLGSNKAFPLTVKKTYDYCGLGIDLVYLTAKQLKEIYTTLNKNRMYNTTKATWAYIISVARNEPDSKFYIYIQAEA